MRGIYITRQRLETGLGPSSLYCDTRSPFSGSCCLYGAKRRILKALQNNNNNNNVSTLLINYDKYTILVYNVNTGAN